MTYSRIRSHFPDPSNTDETGIVAAGGELTSEMLWDAYYHGIFPWPHEGFPLLWFSPPERGILEFKELHIPQSLKKFQKKTKYMFTHNEAFEDVIGFCAFVPRKGQKGTWITTAIKKAYYKFHNAGFAHSFEVWEGENLIGGLYGVLIDGVFSGESMFGLKPNVSKLCLVYVVEYFKKMGLEWIDIQMVTPVTELLGGKYIPRKEFLKKLRKSHEIWRSKQKRNS